MKLNFDFRILLIYLFMFSSLVLFLNCNRIKSKIYKPIESNYFCFRRLNATNQIGCNSNENGNVGVVYIINDDKDLDYVLKTGQHSPYMAVITPKHFNSLIRFKQSSERISGVIVLNLSEQNRTDMNGFSPDQSCPNDRFSLYVNDPTYGHCAKQKWNEPEGHIKEGLMYIDWPFPIFYVQNETNIAEINDCFDRFSGPDWPLCAIELEAPMNAAKDSITCMRRTALQKSSYSLSQTFFCDPLGGTNIFSTLLETHKKDLISNKSIVVLSARLDSFSMFDNIAPGVDSALTSVVTLLSIAKTLNDYKEEIRSKSNKRNVLFALFDGEAFDYIGSSRTVYDMNAGMFPVDPNSNIDLAQIKSEHFSHFIELNQLAPHESANPHNLWIHKNLVENQWITELREAIVNNAKGFPDLHINSITDGRPLPPSSLQSFLKSDETIGGVVIANHEKEYTNKYYNSIYDDIINTNKSDYMLSKRLTNIATVITKSIYQLLTKTTDIDIKVNETLVEGLLECYLSNSACDLFKYVASPDQKFPSGVIEPFPTYVGVFNSASLATASRLYTHMLLSYFTGDVVNRTKDECLQDNRDNESFNFYWMASPSLNGTCIRSQAIKTEALSPAFMTDGEVRDPYLYSTWTESRWRGSTARMFIMPSALQQWLTLITGLIILLVSFVIIYLMDKNSAILFSSNDDLRPQQTLTAGC